jgi:hypothetical protein
MNEAEKPKKKEFTDEELEEIMDRHGPEDELSVQEIRALIRENPLLVTGLVFAFGLLLGLSLSPARKRS